MKSMPTDLFFSSLELSASDLRPKAGCGAFFMSAGLNTKYEIFHVLGDEHKHLLYPVSLLKEAIHLYHSHNKVFRI